MNYAQLEEIRELRRDLGDIINVRSSLVNRPIAEHSQPIRRVLSEIDNQISEVNIKLDERMRPALLEIEAMFVDGRITADEFIKEVVKVGCETGLLKD